jgi:hypothetical protein
LKPTLNKFQGQPGPVPAQGKRGKQIMKLNKLVPTLKSGKVVMSRKGGDVDDLNSSARFPLEREPFVVVETKKLAIAEFLKFSDDLFESRDWLNGKGGVRDTAHQCILVCCDEAEYGIVVNPEGYDYARYSGIVRMK